MAIAGALIGRAIGAFGEKPIVPEFRPIDPSLVQQDTVAGNMAALPGIKNLARAYNQFSLEELGRALEFALPGGLKQAQSLIASQLAGELSPQDTSAIFRNAAASSFGTGFQGSGIGRNIGLRDLGRATVDQRERGLSNFLNLSSRTQAATLNPASMFFTPQQRLDFAARERDTKFNRDLMAAQIAAAPDPADAALGQEIDRFFNTAASFGMMAAGGGMGGMGGGGGGGGGQIGTAGGQGVGIGQSNLGSFNSRWNSAFNNSFY